jgi:hypothetical protein
MYGYRVRDPAFGSKFQLYDWFPAAYVYRKSMIQLTRQMNHRHYLPLPSSSKFGNDGFIDEILKTHRVSRRLHVKDTEGPEESGLYPMTR